MTLPEATAARLASDGHRITAPRREVIRALDALKEPFRIEELSAAVPGVGRATVFRTVKLLQSADVLCRMVLEDGGVRYERSHGGHHHHLICSVCGKVTDFSDLELDTLIQANADANGFRLAGHSVELYGRCGTCA